MGNWAVAAKGPALTLSLYIATHHALPAKPPTLRHYAATVAPINARYQVRTRNNDVIRGRG